MRTIEVSLDVFQMIWRMRRANEQSENDVLRRILENNKISPVHKHEPEKQADQIGKLRWVDIVRKALGNLGGEAKLQEIYEEVKKLATYYGKNDIEKLEATVRQTIQSHSADSRGRRQTNPNYFKKTGRGVWSLTEPA